MSSTSMQAVGFFEQFRLFFDRNLSQINYSRFVGSLMGNMHAVNPDVTGRIPDVMNAAMQSVMVCTTMTCMFSVRYYACELTETRREVSAGINPYAYWLAKQCLILVQEL